MVESAFPIVTTPDLPRALAFYEGLLGGKVSYQFPPEGAPVYVGVDLGSSHLGIGHDPAVADDRASTTAVGRASVVSTTTCGATSRHQPRACTAQGRPCRAA